MTVLQNMTRAEYDSLPGVNWSTIKYLETSPYLLKYRADNPEPDKDCFVFGRALHCAIFEPDRWRDEYVVLPDFGDGRTKAAKEAKAQFFGGLPEGSEVVSRATYDQVLRVAAAVYGHAGARKFVVGGRPEETITWTDEETGLQCKARLDYVRPLELVDLKSTRQTTIRKFRDDAARLLYHGQASFYHDAAIAAGVLPPDAELPVILAPQTVEPYDVVPFRLSRTSYLAGRALWRELIRGYARCREADWWPGLAPSVIDLDLPDWAPGMGADYGDAGADDDGDPW